MEDQGDDKLRPKYGDFSIENSVETLVCSWGLHTTQQPAVSAQSITSPGTLPSADVDTSGGIY